MRHLVALALACALSITCRAVSIEWFEAARMGDWSVIERNLADGADINQADYVGMTALHHALALRQTDVVRRLLGSDADITKASSEYSTWDWAAMGGDIESFRLLMDQKQAVGKLTHPEILQLFEQSIAFGRTTFVTELEKRGSILSKGAELDHALILAVRCEQPEITKHLLDLGANPNRQSNNDEYPLARAAYLGRLDLVDLLLEYGAHINEEGPVIGGSFSSGTALTMAIMADQRAAVRRLLQAGADHQAMDGRPMMLADLIGDAQIRDDLRQAGAPASKPFGFSKWLAGARPDKAKPKESTTAEYWGRQLAAMGVFKGNGFSADSLANRKLAIISLGESLKDAESLLTVRLPAETGAALLERSEMRRIARERNLQIMLETAGNERQAGRILGADVLVILREHTFDKGSLREAKVVAVHTGLVIGTALAEGKIPLDSWTDEIIAICGAAGPLTSDKPESVRLMAVPRVVASLNTAIGRELERQLTVTMAARLGRLPNVIVVERNDLDRLALEQDSTVSNYATSAWLVDATLELPAAENDRSLSLLITLKTRTADASRTLRVEGTLDQIGELVNNTISEIEKVVATGPAEPWRMSEEAAAYLQKARQFQQAFLWADVASSAEAARALGLDTDDIARLRMDAAVQRILHSHQLLIPAKRNRLGYHGIAESVSYRAALLMPVEDPLELDLQGYLDNANLALDIFATSLEHIGEKIAGVPFDLWMCGEFWDAASVPLRLTEPLSYQDEYSNELGSLRARLLELNSRAAALAQSRGEAIAYHTLLGIRLKNLAFWVPDENAFQSEVRTTLASAHDWKPPFSEQPVWTTVYQTARAETRKIGGRAGQAWLRLAEKMSCSDLPNEQYLGICILGMETGSPGRYWEAFHSLRTQLPKVNRMDRGISTQVYEIAVTFVGKTDREIDCLNWYEEAFSGLRGSGVAGWTYRGLWDENAWSITGKNDRFSPEFRAFKMELAMIRAQTLQAGFIGGLMKQWGESRGFTSAELNQVGREFTAAIPTLEALGPPTKQTEYALRYIHFLAEIKGMGTTESVTQDRLIIGPVRNPFLTEIPTPPEYRDKLDIMLLHPNKVSTNWNLFRRDIREVASERHTMPYYFFQFDASGNPMNIHQIPARIGPVTWANGNHLVANERWVCASGGERNPETGEADDIWMVFDTSKNPWGYRIYKAASTGGLLSGSTVIGDHLVYAFVNNPVGERAGKYKNKGDPTFGVININLITGHETLLASNRRQPPTNPWESEQIMPVTDIQIVSAMGLLAKGARKTSKHVYDPTNGTWSVYNAAFKAANKKHGDTFKSTERIHINDVDWYLYGTIKNNQLTVSAKGVKLDIPVIFPENENLKQYSDYKYALDWYGRNLSDHSRSIRWYTKGGLVPMGQGFYYWIPKDQIRSAIQSRLDQQSTDNGQAPH